MRRLAWLLVLPWAVVVSTSFPNFEGQTITYPSPYKAVLPTLGCPNTRDKCLWVQDFVDAMNEAHLWREENNNLVVEDDVTHEAPLTAGEKEFLRKGHLAAIGTPEPQIRTLKATATTGGGTRGQEE